MSGKPTIYLAAIPTGVGSGAVHGSIRGGDVLGCALAEDGHGLAQHLSSSVTFSKHDMGLTSTWQHEHYAEHYQDGYNLVWVDDVATHIGWLSALELNRRLKLDAEVDAVLEPAGPCRDGAV